MKLVSKSIFSNQNILLRVDFNVPKKNNQILDNSKILASKKTITKLIDSKNKIFIVSHLGRPINNKDKNFSTIFLIKELKKIFKLKKIYFCENYDNLKINKIIKQMNFGEICLLENIRYYKEEINNNKIFAKKLSKNFNIYINDSFSSSHRNHSSIVAITKYLPSYAGFLLEKELYYLNKFLSNPKKPSMAIIGGSKISTKISLLKNLVKKMDYIVVGGGMANTFLSAEGLNLRNSLFEKDYLTLAKKIRSLSLKHNCKLILPSDLKVLIKSKKKLVMNLKVDSLKLNSRAMDIGTQSCKEICDLIDRVKTVLWNGPLGVFEIPPFDRSTKKIAQKLSNSCKKTNLKVIIGGGDTLASINKLGISKNYTYSSTSGGAFLEWLEKGKLVGICALKKN